MRLLLFLFSLSFFSFGQNREEDSLKLCLVKVKTTKEYVNVSKELINYYYKKSDENKCEQTYLKAVQRCEQSKNVSELINLRSYFGSTLHSMKQYGKAMDILQQGLKEAKQIKDSNLILIIYTSIGNQLIETGSTEKAAQYYRKALLMDNKVSRKNPETIFNLRFNLSIVYAIQKDYERSISELNILEKEYILLNDEEGLAYLYNNKSQIYSEQKKHKEAEYFVLLAYKYKLKLKSVLEQMNGQMSIAECYLLSGKNKEGIHWGLEAIDLAKKHNIPEIQVERAYSALYQMYASIKDWKKAYEYLKKYNLTYYSDANLANLKDVERKETTSVFNEKIEAQKILKLHEKKLKELTIRKARNERIVLVIGCCLAIFGGIFFYRRYKNSQEKNRIIAEQKLLVEEKNREILDSIHYAKIIQQSLMTSREIIEKLFPGNSLFFLPKDIVSGDFYWAHETETYSFLAICDCTGHGVPGAFMSLMNISFLNEAIKEKGIFEPGDVLTFVREKLLQALPNANDGMDATLLRFEKKDGKLGLKSPIFYAAANNEPLIWRDNLLNKQAKDKMPVGKGYVQQNFRTFEMQLQENDYLLLSTDGFGDQFGGQRGKKMRAIQWLELCNEISLKRNGKEREIFIEKFFKEWKGSLEQVDDLCMFLLSI